MGQKRKAQVRRLTPLGIIAAFITLTEVVLGTAVTQTAGRVQFMLAVFVVSFPILVLIAFFLTLWHRPFVFYPPWEYNQVTDAKSFIDAIKQSRPPIDSYRNTNSLPK